VVRDRIRIDACHAERSRDIQSVRALWQLPQPTEQPLGDAAREHDLVVRAQPQRGAREHRQLALLLSLRDDRKRVLAAALGRRAEHRERTHEAAGRRRRAQRRAELHEALVEIARRVIVGERCDELAGTRPQRPLPGGRLDVVRDRVDPGEHARDVAIDEWLALAVRDRRDRAGRVRPDARDATQLVRATRQLAVPLRGDHLGARLQVARARVVPEPGPRGEHVVERRDREVLHRRELRHPALPVRDHRLDARLLQHDLADPDRVRIARLAPR